MNATILKIVSVVESILGTLPLDPAHKADLNTILTDAKDALSDVEQVPSEVSKGDTVAAVESVATAVDEGAQGVGEAIKDEAPIAAAVASLGTPSGLEAAIAGAFSELLPGLSAFAPSFLQSVLNKL